MLRSVDNLDDVTYTVLATTRLLRLLVGVQVVGEGVRGERLLRFRVVSAAR